MSFSRSPILAACAAVAAMTGLVVAGAPAQAAPTTHSSATDTPVLLTPKGEVAEESQGEEEEGLEKQRDAYYWSPLLTDNPAAVGSSLQPSTAGTPGTANLST